MKCCSLSLSLAFILSSKSALHSACSAWRRNEIVQFMLKFNFLLHFFGCSVYYSVFSYSIIQQQTHSITKDLLYQLFVWLLFVCFSLVAHRFFSSFILCMFFLYFWLHLHSVFLSSICVSMDSPVGIDETYMCKAQRMNTRRTILLMVCSIRSCSWWGGHLLQEWPLEIFFSIFIGTVYKNVLYFDSIQSYGAEWNNCCFCCYLETKRKNLKIIYWISHNSRSKNEISVMLGHCAIKRTDKSLLFRTVQLISME